MCVVQARNSPALAHSLIDGPLPFVLSNTIITIPFLFACALLFSLICYFAIGLHPGGTHFFRFLAYLFLALYAAESQSVCCYPVLRSADGFDVGV
ncbi:MAG: hypothetical protein EOO61_18040 [Hymenobacter sp.]|nr:MAG: hypothetical protein EOO61_18040 [Hymenobacter sp.]